MATEISFHLFSALFSVIFFQATCLPRYQPISPLSLRIKPNQTTTSSCQYTVFITTSCSSTKYTRDYISISFGDAYGNQVYVPRLDDPSSHTFERCSSDTFQINGPCTYDICYLYLLRNGYDGWKPDYVEIYSPYGGAVKFTYNTFLPSNDWYGFNYCSGSSSQGCNRPQRIICLLTLLALLFLVKWR